MSARRPLGDMLGEVAAGALDALAATPQLRVDRMEVTLPVEMQWHWTGGQVRVLGDVPRRVTRTAFDVEPGRITVVWEAREPS